MSNDHAMEDAEFQDQHGEEDDTIDEECLQIGSDSNEGRKRRFRNNSYYKAVGATDSRTFKRNYALRKKSGDESVRLRSLLYQQITEKALDESMDVEDEEDVSGPPIESPSSNEHGRFLWSSLPRVRDSGILIGMSPKERKRQEAMYELYTSEQSYNRSLTVLVDVFIGSSAIRQCTTPTDYHHLFSNLEEIRNSSKSFLHDLEKRFRSSPDAIDDVCDIIQANISNGNFGPYVTYCANEVYQQRALHRLTKQNENFLKAMKLAESSPSCMGLPLHSFLLLPMQRITRLPLLVDMICQRCEPRTACHKSATIALREISRIVKACNDRAKTLQRTEDMITLQQQLEFKTKSFALVSQSRFLVKRGQLTKLSEEIVLGFKKLGKQECHVFLFNDVILMAKKKSDDKFTVNDYCYRHRLKVHERDDEENAFQLIMERNQDGNRVMLRLQADSPSSCARWVTSLKKATKKDSKRNQNCVQVRIVKAFRSDESDMITLQPADVLFVLQVTPDGWYYGEKMVDGRRGWFPSSHAKEVLNERVREGNLRRGNRMHVIETEI